MQKSQIIDKNIQNIDKITDNNIKNDFTETKSNNENIKLDISNQFSAINENLINFENLNNLKEENLLGELLSYLRKNKYMSLLMICKNIVSLDIKDSTVFIEFVNGDTILNEVNLSILREFFKQKNLDIKVKKQEIEKSEIEKLNELFGGKLIIKMSKE